MSTTSLMDGPLPPLAPERPAAVHLPVRDDAVAEVVGLRRTRAATADDLAVGLRIRALRRAAGRTQKQLADHVGVTNAQLHRYEAGISRVAASRLVAIAKALDVRVEDLLNDGAAVASVVMPNPDEFATLARAFAAITDPRHRAALVSLAHTMAGAPAGGAGG